MPGRQVYFADLINSNGSINHSGDEREGDADVTGGGDDEVQHLTSSSSSSSSSSASLSFVFVFVRSESGRTEHARSPGGEILLSTLRA